jgi:hypothetical protein
MTTAFGVRCPWEMIEMKTIHGVIHGDFAATLLTSAPSASRAKRSVQPITGP